MNWNKAQDGLPEKFRECILYPYPDEYNITGFMDGSGFYTAEYDSWGVTHRRLKNVTHWMYLEEPEE